VVSLIGTTRGDLLAGEPIGEYLSVDNGKVSNGANGSIDARKEGGKKHKRVRPHDCGNEEKN
jgi:hypothetical protein